MKIKSVRNKCGVTSCVLYFEVRYIKIQDATLTKRNTFGGPAA